MLHTTSLSSFSTATHLGMSYLLIRSTTRVYSSPITYNPHPTNLRTDYGLSPPSRSTFG
jgi:hypothetical protein